MPRAVFLDRDGTLNEDPGYFHEADKLVILPHIPEALRRLKEAGFLLIVVTNQGGIATGMYPLKDMQKVHEVLQAYLAPFHAKIDDFFYCPHVEEENCPCRKPKPGMIIAARDKFGIQLEESYVVGDKISDLQAGRAAGCRTLLVLTGDGKDELVKVRTQKLNVADFVVKDMGQAAEAIVREARQRGWIDHR